MFKAFHIENKKVLITTIQHLFQVAKPTIGFAFCASALLLVAMQHSYDKFLVLLDLVTIARGGKKEKKNHGNFHLLLADKLSSALTFTILHT